MKHEAETTKECVEEGQVLDEFNELQHRKPFRESGISNELLMYRGCKLVKKLTVLCHKIHRNITTRSF